MIRNLADINNIVSKYYTYLEKRNLKFDDNGFPVLPKSCYLDIYPQLAK